MKKKILSLVPRIPFISINVELWDSVSLKVTLKKKKQMRLEKPTICLAVATERGSFLE